jgi:hypothetical protein
MSACRICGVAECDNDCEELARLYSEAQREELRNNSDLLEFEYPEES